MKQARAAGDGGAAVAIGKLAKPNRVAWLANQLVREDADGIRALLQLGESMRQATASLAAEQLRQASRQRASDHQCAGSAGPQPVQRGRAGDVG